MQIVNYDSSEIYEMVYSLGGRDSWAVAQSHRVFFQSYVLVFLRAAPILEEKLVKHL